MKNVSKCSRCSKDLISEEFNEHVCNAPYLGIIELGINYWFEGKSDKNGDQIFIVKGLDGMIYRLVKCSHNPPHPDTRPTSFDSEKFRRRLDRTQKQYPYKVLVPYHTV